MDAGTSLFFFFLKPIVISSMILGGNLMSTHRVSQGKKKAFETHGGFYIV
jgi:hypothetical protein